VLASIQPSQQFGPFDLARLQPGQRVILPLATGDIRSDGTDQAAEPHRRSYEAIGLKAGREADSGALRSAAAEESQGVQMQALRQCNCLRRDSPGPQSVR